MENTLFVELVFDAFIKFKIGVKVKFEIDEVRPPESKRLKVPLILLNYTELDA